MKKYLLWAAVVVVCVASVVGFMAHRVVEAKQAESEGSRSRVATLSRVSPPPIGTLAAVDNSEAEALMQKGAKQYAAKNYAGASDAFYKATMLVPDVPAAHFYLAMCYLQTNDTRAAIRELKMITNLSDDHYEQLARLYMAKAFMLIPDRTSAEEQLNYLIDQHSSVSSEAEKLKSELGASDM